ncbi:family 78 glycoside hydrolase catalytic domain [Streptomyces scopuliridis]|uniref:family 78 glycoside hydrolase catalytic domain n=1 Tax=Streptomyces scopuliridis TaxID=452529 RepID=UPI00369C52D2
MRSPTASTPRPTPRRATTQRSSRRPTSDVTKWVQTDLGSDQKLHTITPFPARPTNDTAGDFIGAGFPVRYKVQVSDDPTFTTATTVVDRTGAGQPNPGTTPVAILTDATGRYIRLTATRHPCIGSSCTFQLAELGAYGEHTTTALDANGEVSTSKISFAASNLPRQTNHYTFNGAGQESYTPHFNYAGFRYAKITGLPAGAKVTVAAQAVHTDVPAAGSFSTSDPPLNQIQSAVSQTQLNDLESIPVDCPTRERHGRLGDAGDTDQEEMSTSTCSRSTTSGSTTSAPAPTPTAGLPSVAPANGGQSSWATDPAWGNALLFLLVGHGGTTDQHVSTDVPCCGGELDGGPVVLARPFGAVGTRAALERLLGNECPQFADLPGATVRQRQDLCFGDREHVAHPAALPARREGRGTARRPRRRGGSRTAPRLPGRVPACGRPVPVWWPPPRRVRAGCSARHSGVRGRHGRRRRDRPAWPWDR